VIDIQWSVMLERLVARQLVICHTVKNDMGVGYAVGHAH